MSYLDIVRAQLRIDEGVVRHVYADSEGYWTIGCGRLVDQRLNGGLSQDEINYLLDNDILRAELDARALFPSFDRLSDVRKAVLVNLSFNLGKTRLAGFKQFKAALEAQAWEQAAAELLDSKWATQVGDRSKRLAQQMKDG
jgi:lysozyme